MATVQKIKGKKGDTFRVQFMRDSKRVTKTFKKRNDADKFLATLILHDDVMQAVTSDILNSMLLGDAIVEYLAQHTGKDTNVKQRLNWWLTTLGNVPIGKVGRLEVKKALQSILDAGKSPATCNRFKCGLSSLFEYLKDEYQLTHNPARQVKQMKESAPVDRYLSEQELERLLGAAKQSEWDRMYLLILMALTTGARRSELTGLRWDQVSMRNRTARLSDTKNGKPRVLTFTADVVAELEKYREVGNGWLFPRPHDITKNFYHFDVYWYQTLKAAEIENFRFHDLRHSCASWLAMAGYDLKMIADVLGHKTLTTTARYTHLSTAHKAKAVDSVFGGISNG